MDKQLKNKKIIFENAFYYSLCFFVLMTGLGEINLKPYGIPFSVGGGLEKLIPPKMPS